MAHRFLFEVRDPGRAESESVAQHLAQLDLRLIYSSSRVRLFANQPDAMRRWGKTVAFGHLFERDATPLPGADRSGILDIRCPAEVLQHYWGSYSLCFESDDRVEIMRDPSGMLPCYYGSWDDIFYVASDVPLLCEASGQQPAIDWHELGRTLYVNGLPQRTTALAGIFQLLPGMTLKIVKGRAEETIIWSPWTCVDRQAPNLNTFRQIVLDCITAWATQFPSILIGVSGGLDSSIVALGARHHAELHAFTIATGDPRGDERSFARGLARALNIPLFEATYDLSEVDISRSSFIHAPRPGGRAQLQAYDKLLVDLAKRHSANAFFSGVGGDNVFYLSNSARPLVDRYLMGGTLTDLRSTLLDICRLTGSTPWQVFRQVLQIPRVPGPKYHWRPNAELLAPAVIDHFKEEQLTHPWLEGPVDSLPGKAAHIAMIIRAQGYMEAQDRRFPFDPVHPLMSQPIIEACLSVPSWEACRGGSDRSFTRRAFTGDLPPTVIERRIKGGPDHFALQILRSHLPAIRTRLMDGALLRNHIVDGRALEMALTEASLASGGHYTRILSLLDTEAWIDGWSTADLRPSWL
ncbi:asparagine synthetase B family protein [Sphingopyxis indica]|uniref:asparagine synthase (glutamine-hydrolyzing) n=1 Tax=Sphingopyxis indica TaxID=436663 RepID=A0A239IRR9_9SPHN|nr:asparagine synthetase B family protein [Sphingopyxis indica]SNS96235.1 asparagine synthase (glutamine-hydrolysing) [Sphingopyxis indica]